MFMVVLVDCGVNGHSGERRALLLATEVQRAGMKAQIRNEIVWMTEMWSVPQLWEGRTGQQEYSIHILLGRY